jgi:hypothetical protein
MQKSKSINSFAPTTEHTEFIQGTRSQRRSSLDTFVIPGRTRLPSSQSSQNATDIQVAQALLNHRSGRHSIKMAAREAQGRTVLACEHSSTPITYANLLQSTHGGSDVNTRLPPSRGSGPNILVIPPHRRSIMEVPQAPPELFMATTTATNTEADYGNTYDGANDNNQTGKVSRMTSMTWSTVSQRVYSDSSGSSRASRVSEFKQEYNGLAKKHGLPTLTGEYAGILCPPRLLTWDMVTDFHTTDDESNSSQTKLTQKSHHHGWLARKFFRRSSSTYTLKAKTTYKPVTHKKSYGGVRLLSDDVPTNILSGRSLEGLCRLGGVGLLVLPPDFAADRLSLPTCLSATGTYLLDNGMSS